jgi:hypothetical protein
LGFTDASLGDQEVGEGAIGSGDGLGVGFLRVAGKVANVSPNGFDNVDGLFVEDDRQLSIIALSQQCPQITEECSFTRPVFDCLKDWQSLVVVANGFVVLGEQTISIPQIHQYQCFSIAVFDCLEDRQSLSVVANGFVVLRERLVSKPQIIQCSCFPIAVFEGLINC